VKNHGHFSPKKIEMFNQCCIKYITVLLLGSSSITAGDNVLKYMKDAGTDFRDFANDVYKSMMNANPKLRHTAFDPLFNAIFVTPFYTGNWEKAVAGGKDT
jgi:hypothetical protein